MSRQRVLITGGAGFIGSNAAVHYMKQGWDVIVLDDLSRVGSKLNLQWLHKKGQFTFIEADIRDFRKISEALDQYGPITLVLHLASQVAVTTSVNDPRTDFEINALGTFNLLEAVRLSGTNPIMVYASTNKVYGALEHIELIEREQSYELNGYPYGVDETVPLDFHSPYGCSKGAADQYIRDYHRIYGLRTIVFRQSCIYGPRQFGVEDQGWLAHFLISIYRGKGITLYGNGKQVRDLLYIDDLIRAYDMAAAAIDRIAGQVYNLGGGHLNRLSLLQAIARIESKTQNRAHMTTMPVRPGDQMVFVADVRKAFREFGWAPTWTVERGMERLMEWVVSGLQGLDV